MFYCDTYTFLMLCLFNENKCTFIYIFVTNKLNTFVKFFLTPELFCFSLNRGIKS